jgi:endoglucanase
LETLKLLRTVSETIGITGHEEGIREVVKELWQPFTDEFRTDALGNLIALQKGSGQAPRPGLMVAAHMDEIGLIVTGFEDEFLRVQSIRGTDPRAVLGSEVLVHGRETLPGIIGTRPPHVLKAQERKKIVPWREIYVDVGLPEAELKQQVQVGDVISIVRPLITLQNQRAAGKALDNRASVAALTLALEILRRREHPWDLYAVATVQEEMGVKGAVTSAYGIDPQAAVAIDVTFANQSGDSGPETFEMNKGPTIAIGANCHPQLVERLREVADAEEIPYQLEPVPGNSGTDAWAIQVTREGVPTALLGIPIRYMHQPVESVALQDIERCARLLAAFVTHLEGDYRPHWPDETESAPETESE